VSEQSRATREVAGSPSRSSPLSNTRHARTYTMMWHSLYSYSRPPPSPFRPAMLERLRLSSSPSRSTSHRASARLSPGQRRGPAHTNPAPETWDDFYVAGLGWSMPSLSPLSGSARHALGVLNHSKGRARMHRPCFSGKGTLIRTVHRAAVIEEARRIAAVSTLQVVSRRWGRLVTEVLAASHYLCPSCYDVQS
jgi:hypothetical protein